MAAEWLKDLLKVAIAVGLSGARGGAGAASVLSGGLGGFSGMGGGAMPSGASEFMAKQYPEEFAPKYNHEYNVIAIPGAANFNTHGKADAAIIQEAGRMQTLKEHNDAITKYMRPGMTPRQLRDALNMGADEEKNLPQFWNESKSRRRFSVSSSAVNGIRLTPDGRVEVSWQSNPAKWYTFKQYPDVQKASLAAQKLLMEDSIGRAVAPFQRKGKLIKYKDPIMNGTRWNTVNYDPAFAG